MDPEVDGAFVRPLFPRGPRGPWAWDWARGSPPDGGPVDDEEEGAMSGEGVGFMNIDLVPSTKRPPSGGPGERGGENVLCCVAKVLVGVEGPAPGD